MGLRSFRAETAPHGPVELPSGLKRADDALMIGWRLFAWAMVLVVILALAGALFGPGRQLGNIDGAAAVLLLLNAVVPQFVFVILLTARDERPVTSGYVPRTKLTDLTELYLIPDELSGAKSGGSGYLALESEGRIYGSLALNLFASFLTLVLVALVFGGSMEKVSGAGMLIVASIALIILAMNTTSGPIQRGQISHGQVRYIAVFNVFHYLLKL